MASFVVQRKNMVESQVRPSDVTDRRVIRAMAEVPRERFIPGELAYLAYADRDVPLSADGNGAGRAVMAPRVLARILQNLEIGSNDLALEIGTGMGYGAALLGRIAQTVVALECDPVLAKVAGELLSELGVDNAVVVTGDLQHGYAVEGPYDVMLVSGCVSAVPETLLDQLKHGGRLIAVVASENGLGHVVRWQRFGDTFDKRVLFEAGAAMLPGFEAKPQFVF